MGGVKYVVEVTVNSKEENYVQEFGLKSLRAAVVMIQGRDTPVRDDFS
jgi:hypothetical protein